MAQTIAAALLAPLPGDGGATLLHHVCTGESLGVGGCLLLSLAGAPARPAAGGGAAVWPARHQRGRAQVLALLLARQPRLALLAGSRDAARNTPLHCCVLSRSWQVLALLLEALQQLLPRDAAGSQPAQQWQQQQGAAAALQLLLSVPDGGGLSALELAIRLRQWPAARLLAAAAGGGLPISKPQVEACSLVRQYLRLSRTGSGGSQASSSGGLAAGVEQPGMHVSASGATVTEALGGLLSKLWDAFGSTPAGEAAADELAAAARLTGAPQSSSGSSGSGGAGQPGGTQAVAASLRLQPRAVSQADVLALVREEERAAAEAAAADAAACSSGPAAAAPSGSAPVQCIVCFDEVAPDALPLWLPCGHPTCGNCWRGILQASIDEGRWSCCRCCCEI